MKIKFDKDLIYSDIAPVKPGEHFLFGNGILPRNVDVFFKAKWHELYYRYEHARMHLLQTSDEKYDDWGIKHLGGKEKEYAELMIRASLYESSLCFYNIVVDLSWALTYVCAEYVVYDSSKRILTDAIMPVEETFHLLRKMENNVVSPTAEDSPFSYLRKMNSDFEPAIKVIEDFWDKFGNSDIRKNYNFIKHKGSPIYKEVDDLVAFPRLFAFEKEFNGKTIECPSDVRDVSKILVLEDEIKKLLDFDNDELLPYISKLLGEIIRIITPSEMII